MPTNDHNRRLHCSVVHQALEFVLFTNHQLISKEMLLHQKTTLAHVVAKHAGYNVIEMNAR